MTLDEASLEFAPRYYRWAERAAEADIASGFSMLRLLNDVRIEAFLGIVDSMAPDDVRDIVSLYQRRAFRRASSPLSQIDEMKFEEFRQKYVARIGDQTALRKGRKKIVNTRTMHRLIADVLPATLGAARQLEPGAWEFSRQIDDDWILLTAVATDRVQLGYIHSIVTVKRSSAPPNRFLIGCTHPRLYGDISILSWIGLGVDECWDLSVSVDERALCQSISACAKCFMDALPELLLDLKNIEV